MMNKKLQTNKIAAALKKKGVEPDLVDLESEIDESLTLRENYQIILENYGLIGESKTVKGESETKNVRKMERFMEAKEKDEKLPEKLRIADDKFRAKRTFQMGELNQKNYQKWKKNRNRYDIEGVDASPQSIIRVRKHKRKTLKTKPFVRRHRRKKPRK